MGSRGEETDGEDNDGSAFCFSISGAAAHMRLQPLLQPAAQWKDVTTLAQDLPMTMTSTSCTRSWEAAAAAAAAADNDDDDDLCRESKGKEHNQPAKAAQAETRAPHFLWENAPRRETKAFRDTVRCYSHLPNGTDLLDSKWALARLFAPSFFRTKGPKPHSCTSPEQPENTTGRGISLVTPLETYCFRGKTGFDQFARHVGLLSDDDDVDAKAESSCAFPDLLGTPSASAGNSPPAAPKNWWVIKDAGANGAGGIWVVLGAPGVASVVEHLQEGHRYVAQRYAWPLVLYRGRKFHVRVYGLITSDGRAFVHRQCFLHVANQPFHKASAAGEGTAVEANAEVHITNCCANSHDPDQFAGEICADLLLKDDENSSTAIVALGAYFPSIRATVATLAERALPYLAGGQANGGFEYLGLDCVLSSTDDGRPCAYLLEVNAPPSQDTATGLSHAEALHNAVLQDLLTLWVFPKVRQNVKEQAGGWQCVYQAAPHDDTSQVLKPLVPSKTALLNRMKWTLREQKALKEDARLYGPGPSAPGLAARTVASQLEEKSTLSMEKALRSFYPYFSSVHGKDSVFLESAGGSQVPRCVMDRMMSSLQYRHRALVGKQVQQDARNAVRELVGASSSDFDVFLGPNATTLLTLLARALQPHLGHGSEIVIATENHLAHVTPWLELAEHCQGCAVKWWTTVPSGQDDTSSSHRLEDLVTEQTKIVALSHASNVLGELRDLKALVRHVRQRFQALVVVDGVAAVPHVYADLSSGVDENDLVDYYVVSCHKVFGPHLGALLGRRGSQVPPRSALEVGTVNYEACAGVLGTLEYLKLHVAAQLGSCESVADAYRLIRRVEVPLVRRLVQGLTQSSTKVRILQRADADAAIDWEQRLPVVSIVHRELSSTAVETACHAAGFWCRGGTFLSTKRLLREQAVLPESDGMVRFSLAHYNTRDEVERLLSFLASLQGWS